MDDRQRQIREGAGLEESRLNQDFIEFLRRWSTPVLLVVALAAAGYAGYSRYEEYKAKRVAKAYEELENVTSSANPSPASLRGVADEFEGVGSVSLVARLSAADAYLRAVRIGLKPGAQLTAMGEVQNKDDLLTDEDRKENLAQAEALYQKVYDDANHGNAQVLLAMGAAYGLAAVAESRNDLAAAKAAYERVVQLVDGGPYQDQAKLAKARIADLDTLAKAPVLISQAELPKPPAPPVPAAAEAPAGDAPKLDVGPAVPSLTPPLPAEPPTAPEQAPQTPPK